MIDVSSLQFLLFILIDWLDRRERQVLAYLMEVAPPAAPPLIDRTKRSA